MDARKILNLPASPGVNRSVLEDCKKNVINEKRRANTRCYEHSNNELKCSKEESIQEWAWLYKTKNKNT